MGALTLEALRAPVPAAAWSWMGTAFPLYGACALGLWVRERFWSLDRRVAPWTFALDIGLVATAAKAFSGGPTDFFIACFLVILSSTFLRKPALSFLVASAVCLVYGLSIPGDLAVSDPSPYMKVALLAAMAFFSVFMTNYARKISDETAEPYEKRLAWMERLSLVGRALAGVLHEVKSPLGAILLGAENCRTRLKRGEEAGPELDLIEGEAERASEIIVNFLEFTRPAKLSLSRLRLADPLEKALSVMSARLEEQNIHLERGPMSELFVMGSERHLIQVFTNLLNNAAAAMPSGGKLSMALERSGDLALVRIIDNGCGIATERLERLLDNDPTGRPAADGCGLGLDIVRWILQKHHGRLLLSSPGPGLGAAAVVELPASS